jgi:peptidyl-prolyl cis-trans isomerase C
MKTSRTSMLTLASACALALACNNKKSLSEQKSGPVVAVVGNDTITADEFKKKLDEVSPFLRARYNTVERKKEFLENLIRNELLVQEAEKRGLENTPAVREQLKRALVTELLRQQLDERLTGADIADADLKSFYDQHHDDFVKPERARVFRIFIEGAKSDPKAHAAAKKKATELLAEITAKQKAGDLNAFQATALRESNDKLSAPMSGDLRFLSREEMAKTYSPELADASFGLKQSNDIAGPIETAQGYELVKLQAKTVALDRKFEEAKDQIRGRMARERRSKEYDDFIKKLREGANVKIDDAELAKVGATEAPAAPTPGAPPAPGAMAPAPAPTTMGAPAAAAPAPAGK